MHKLIFCITIVAILFSTSATFAEETGQMTSQREVMQNQENRLAEKNAARQNARRQNEQFISSNKISYNLQKIELPKEQIDFRIDKFIVESDYTGKKFDWISQYLAQYSGSRIGQAGINLLLDEVNKEILRRGYVTTRVYVGKQNLSSGQLIITLKVGTVGRIYFADKTMTGTWKNAFPIKHGDLFNIYDIDQGLEQMQRLPSQNVDTKILPGQKQGESDIELVVKRTKPWRAMISVDDSGLKSTGKLQMTTALELDNLLSSNDIFEVSLNEDGEQDGRQKGTRANDFYYAIPWGKETFSFSAYTYDYHQRVDTAINPFMSSGRMDTFDFGITRLLDRDQIQKTNLELHILRKKRHSYINGTEINVQKEDTTAMQLGFTKRKYIGRSILDAAIFYQKGVGWLGAEPGSADDTPGGPTTKYNLYFFNMNWTTPIKLGRTVWEYNLTARGQYTKDALYGSEYFSIGGRYSVRGFDGEQTLSADSGLVLRNELRLPIFKNQQLYAAFDYGKVTGPGSEYLLGKELAGAAIGMRGAIKNVSYDVFVGWPVSKPDGFDAPKSTSGFLVTVLL